MNNLYLIFILFTTITFIAFLRLVVKKISNSLIREITERNPQEKKILQKWHTHKSDYLIILNYLIIFLLLTSFFCIFAITFEIDFLHKKVLLNFAIIFILSLIVTIWKNTKNLIFSSTPPPLSLLKKVLPFVNLLKYIFSPIVFFIKILTKNWHEKNEIKQKNSSSIEDEILNLVGQDQDQEESEGTSELELEERKMIQGIFNLDDTTVNEIMTPRIDIVAIEDTATIPEIKKLIIESGHSRIPIFHDNIDEIVGVIYAKDLLDEEKIKVDKITKLCRKSIFIPEAKNVSDLFQDFRANKQHFAIVVDEYGGTSGIISIEDIIEEIVGDIQDEYDANEENYSPRINNDGTITLDGRFSIYDFEEIIKYELKKEDDTETIAGFLIDYTGKIPTIGEVVITENIRFEILDADERKIDLVKVTISSIK